MKKKLNSGIGADTGSMAGLAGAADCGSEMPAPARPGIPACRMTSAGADTGPENRRQQKCCGDRHLRPAPHAQMMEW